MKTVFQSPSQFDVQERKVFLENAGIDCSVLNEGIRSALGELPIVELKLVVLDDSRAEEATSLLEQFTKGDHSHPEAWVCGNCGERCEGQFTECWKCGKSHSERQ